MRNTKPREGPQSEDLLRSAALDLFSWARRIIVDDFEFTQNANKCNDPICFVTKELRSGECVKLWRDQLDRHPFSPQDKDTILIAHAASAEMQCYLALGWPVPAHIIDTYAESRNHFNIAVSKNDARTNHCRLFDALAGFGIAPTRNRTTEEKTRWRDLFIANGPWTPELREGGLDYCADDVLDTERLFYRLAPTFRYMTEVFKRGKFAYAAAKVERTGIPIDMSTFYDYREHREMLVQRLVEDINEGLNIYVGASLNNALFGKWLAEAGIHDWPRTRTGDLKTDKETLKDMEGVHPSIVKIKELQKTISGMKNNDLSLAIGADGRNRTSVRAFGASSSRNTPRASEFIFGQAKWYRNLIKPEQGFSLAYFDYEQQEFAIAAVLSKDEAMKQAYLTENPLTGKCDPYMAMVLMTGFEPTAANRRLFKTCTLGIQYGSGPRRLARQLGIPFQKARDLHLMHRMLFPKFWDWTTRIAHHAMAYNELHTVYGWTTRPALTPRNDCPGIYTDPPNIRAICNFPMQANGGEILREATCRAVDAGVDVCGLVHDAIVIVSPTSRFAEDKAKTLAAMEEASRLVLGGFTLRIEEVSVSWPHNFADKDGAPMWAEIQRLMAKAHRAAA
jgi:DNA polymerase family A